MVLCFEQIVPAATADVFTFHEDPANLVRLLRTWPGFRMLRHDSPIRRGGVMWVQEAFLTIPVALGFRCTHFERPHRLGGALFHGPFDRFTHLHEFTACDGGTRVVDRLEVTVPWEFGGGWTASRLIAPLLTRAFACRQRELARLAEQGALSAMTANDAAAT